MSRERIVRLALRAYPPLVRTSSGTEMVGTLLHSSGQSNAAFARELVDLVRRGLAARATSTARLGARRLIADGMCYGGTAIIAELLCVRVGDYLSHGQVGTGRGWAWEIGLLALALALALVGYDRIAAICGFAFFAVVTGVSWRSFDTNGLLLPDLIILVGCFAPMLIAPRQRRRDIRRLAWLVVIATLGAVFFTPRGGVAALYLLPVAVGLPFALALLPTDPRFAIACSFVGAFVALVGLAQSLHQGRPDLGLPLIIIGLIATPLILTIAATRTRALRRRDPA